LRLPGCCRTCVFAILRISHSHQATLSPIDAGALI
jgi:hypothetical protein